MSWMSWRVSPQSGGVDEDMSKRGAARRPHATLGRMGELADKKKVEKLAARQASYGSLEAVCRSTLCARLSANFAAKSETPRTRLY